jgi:DNA polymerase-3 subunit alpha
MTIDSHFTTPDLKKVQDILLSNGEEGGWTFHNSYHMMTTEEAWANWVKINGNDTEQRKIFTEAVENNDVLVNMAKGLKIEDPYQQPTPNIPERIILNTKNKDEALKVLLIQKIEEHGRIDFNDDIYMERLWHELGVICDNGVANFGNYFGSLEEWCKWAIDQSILSAPGRGSAAGCLVAYGLKITHLDPIKYNLPFSRFLSLPRIKRGKFPDVDWDLGNRDLLVAYLRERYGKHMAQASTLHTLKVKSAIKDACRSILKWNSQDPRVADITKGLPKAEPQGISSEDVLLGYTDQDGNIHDGWIMQYPALDQFFKQYPQVYECVIALLGIPRAVSRHASAYVIADRDISMSAPTCVISGYLCTQYNANAAFNSLEKAGLVKYDFLRVNTLDDISNCIRLVQKKFGYKVWEDEVTHDEEKFKVTRGDLRIDQLPIDDKGTILDVYTLPEDQEVFDQLSEGRTETVFQMNSSLMTGFTKRIKPKSIMDLSDIVALVRPGPLTADTGEKTLKGNTLTMTEAYIARRHGKIPVNYAHPGMEPILKDTFGVAVYQEQLQQMFSDLAGYSPEEADAMREMLAKKKKAEVEKAIPELRKRLAERGWKDNQIDVFVSLCIASSAYSFNRAHSASYGMVAYMCSYLKTKFPLEWWCSVLGGASLDDIREKGYARTLLRDGILQLPHVNGPTDTFRLVDGMVHAPLYLIDRVGDAACVEIQRARGNIPFTSFQDFYERVAGRGVNEAVFHNLIICGAFDTIEKKASTQRLIEDYHYFKKVNSLKIGKNPDDTPKRGAELLAAVDIYKKKEIEKNVKLSVEEMYLDTLQIEIRRVNALPI